MFFRVKWLVYALIALISWFGLDTIKDGALDAWGDYKQGKAHKKEVEAIQRENAETIANIKRNYEKRINALSHDTEAREREAEAKRRHLLDRALYAERLLKKTPENAEIKKNLDCYFPAEFIK